MNDSQKKGYVRALGIDFFLLKNARNSDHVGQSARACCRRRILVSTSTANIFQILYWVCATRHQ